MTQANVLCASLSSAILEVIFTHPIDHYKTLLQHQKFNNLSERPNLKWNNLYKGVFPRLYGVVPMRLVFWTSLDSGNKHFNNPFYAATFASFNQTLIDYPIEFIKIRNMTHNQSIKKAIITFAKYKHYFGFSSTLLRNMGFASIFNILTHKYIKKDDSVSKKLTISGLSGFMAATITQPFDYFKTCAQSDSNARWLTTFNNIKTFPELFTGLWGRNTVSLLAMGIGFTTFEIGKCYFNEIL